VKKRLLIALVIVLALAATASVVWAGKPDNFDDKGNATSWENGPFDKWGYNYQAHIFSGLYHNASRPEPPCELGTCASDTYLVMKWSDVWLSNVDSNDDGKLDRGYVDCRGAGTNPDLTQSNCPGAWDTNHQRGEYVNDEGRTCKWIYFVKIVYPDYTIVDADDDKYDDNTGARILWGAYVVIQSVSNDTCAGEHGIRELQQPAGFGAYK